MCVCLASVHITWSSSTQPPIPLPPFPDDDQPPDLDISQETYVDQNRQQSTINHFHEKLLKLAAMMKTDTGRAMAQSRHDYMVAFLERFEREVKGEC